MLPQWTVPSNYELATLTERLTVSIPLPLASTTGVTTSIITGELPGGLRLENNAIVGTPFEVARTTTSTVVIRAATTDGILDRTFKIIVEGADNPVWVTPEGRLPVGPNSVYFILDSSVIDFQLMATDNDLPTGQTLEYYIADGDGELPPGISLTTDGRLIGVVDPLLALDINDLNGGYDTAVFATAPYDFSVPSGSGLDTFYYDTTTYDYSIPTRRPKKLNRVYEFQVTVADNVAEDKRRFQIYVVGDDFVRGDNTIMKAADGVFTADVTYIRTPVWLTPADLGRRRANNYLTIYLETLDQNTTAGVIRYILEGVNNDNTPSVLPPGLVLDPDTGELAGRVPYQPAVTKEYKFTVNALRYNFEMGVVTVFGTFIEDVLSGKSTFKVGKLPTTTVDGINDLQALIGKEIPIGGRYYTVSSVDDTNDDYDEITLTTVLQPTPAAAPLTLARTAYPGQNYFFVNTLTTNDNNFYTEKTINFATGEVHTIDAIKPYVEWVVTIDDSAGDIELNTGITGFDTNLVTTLENYFALTGQPAYINTISGFSGIVEISMLIPSTSKNRNTNYIKSLFHTSDSSEIHATNIAQQDRVALSNNLVRTLETSRQISLGVYTGDSFSRSFPRAEEDIIEKKKTFTISMLGEVDSTITWNTDNDLGILAANRNSTLRLSATTTIPDAVLRYSLVSGKLPPGIILKTDGELVGRTPLYPTETSLGLTFFDAGTVSWDSAISYTVGQVIKYGSVRYICTSAHTSSTSDIVSGALTSSYWDTLTSDTTFDGSAMTYDREYTFTVIARDRFGYSAITREFTLTIGDDDTLTYSNLYMRPLLKTYQKNNFLNLVNNSQVIDPRLVYRPSDTNFGVQKDLKSLVYAGIETNEISTFVSAVAKNHKRKRFILGDIKTAVAKQEGTNDVVYEVVYVELIDPAKPTSGKTRNSFQTINTNGKITVDSIKYETKDDAFAARDGAPQLYLTDISGNIISLEVFNDTITVTQRDGTEVEVATQDGSIIIVTRSGSVLTLPITVVDQVLGDGSPWRFRPKGNTITSDSDAVKISQSTDSKKYISNIDNMRDRIKAVGPSSRDFLPLWMRTPQGTSLADLDYVHAIPLVYTKPGNSETIKNRIINYFTTSGYDLKEIDYDIDRYIIDSTTGNSNEQYVLFANYQFNV